MNWLYRSPRSAQRRAELWRACIPQTCRLSRLFVAKLRLVELFSALFKALQEAPFPAEGARTTLRQR
jgi:hypothetical protein